MCDIEAVCDCVLFLHGGKGRGNRARRGDVPAPARSAIADGPNGELAVLDAYFEHLPRVIRHPLPHVMIPHHPPDVLAIAKEHEDVIGLKDPVGQRDAEDLADRLAGGAESGGAAALGDGDQIQVVL